MADRPMIFSTLMVRALLAGRKTQHRAMLKSARTFSLPDAPACTLRGDNLAMALRNASGFRLLCDDSWTWEADAFSHQAPAARTTWFAHIGFAAGDRYWVRELWRSFADLSQCTGPDDIAFAANADEVEWAISTWKSPILMPRWASRLTLTVTDVSVQRLHNITEKDALAEGVGDGILLANYGSARRAYRHLWEQIHGAEAWDANPYVVAITVAVRHGNIDAQVDAAPEAVADAR